jgi:hypothetical protein
MFIKRLLLIISSFFLPISFLHAATEPEFKLGGKFYFNLAAPQQSDSYSRQYLPHGTNNLNHIDGDSKFATDNYLDFLLIDRSDSGILYGARVGVAGESALQSYYQYDNNLKIVNKYRQDSMLVRRAFIFAERKDFGRIEVGDVDSASKKLKFDASYRFGGTGGIAGKWWKYVNIPDFGLQYDSSMLDGSLCSSYKSNDIRSCNKGNMGFLIRPDLPISHGYNDVSGPDKFDDTRTLLRFSFYTPRIYGFQYGFSYAGSTKDRGSSYYGSSNNLYNKNNVDEIYDFALNYVEQYGKLGLAFSATAERAKIINLQYSNDNIYNRKDLAAYALGTYIFYGNLSFSGSYGIWGDSLMMIANGMTANDPNYRKNSANYYTIGLGYQFGPYKFGISNLTSEYREQEFSLYSLALDYRFTKYFSLFGELNFYDFNAKDNSNNLTASAFETKNNKGEVLLLGAKIEFGGFDSASQILLDTSVSQY